MALESIDALMLKLAKDARKKEHANVNDTESLPVLKEMRPHLYYKREKYKAKRSTGQGDWAGFLRATGKLPKILPDIIIR